MVDREPDADPLADRVIVMRGHQREHARSGRELQRVHEIRTAERLGGHFRLPRAVVVVHDVVGPNEQVHGLAVGRRSTASASRARQARSRRVPLAGGDTAKEHALPHEVGDESRARSMVEVVRGVPLLDRALVHDADLVGERERLVLVVRDQDRRRVRSP